MKHPLLHLVLTVYVALAASAADKNGVSPNSISLPKGPGSVEGLGESFQPALNTGTAKYALGLKLPLGTAGHQPKISLNYDGGGANGPLGYGWTIPLPHIQRRTDKGIPTYGQSLGVNRADVFINEMREVLVPITNGFYFCENESAFVRYRQVSNHWEGTAPNGTRMEFGLSPAARIEDAASSRVFCWLLERETDTRGNVIEYAYSEVVPGERQKYLTVIRYGPSAPPWSHFHFVAFDYEDRSDWFEDGRAGFLVRTSKRLKSIGIGTQGTVLKNHLSGDFEGDGLTDYLNRRYDLAYLPYAGEGSHWSLLSTVTVVGADGVSALPPARFDYVVSDPPDVIDASSNVWSGVNEPPLAMDNDLVELADLNADGLPDVLKTDSGGGAHTAWVNRGRVQQAGVWAIQWAPSADVNSGNGTAWNFHLAADRTHLADMNGDGLADLVHKSVDDAVFFFANRGNLSWGTRQEMAINDAAPPTPFGNPTVRAADIDFDKRIDVIQSVESGGSVAYRVWFNLGDQTYSAPFTIEPDGGFDLSLPGVHFADCNGDRVPDAAQIRPGAVHVAAGIGYGRFAAVVAMPLPNWTLDDAQILAAKLVDVNGDGLADLVLERAAPGQCWYWLNLGNYTFQGRKIFTGLPPVAAGKAVRWADLNGNGTTDLIYCDSTAFARIQMVEVGALINGGLAPNLLTRIENGIGSVTFIEYAPSTQFALADASAGKPWPDAVPFPVTVVAAIRTSDSLGHQYVSRFRYHDGFYDAVEKQFRGFAHVEQIEIGDAGAPTLVSRSRFDTGREFDVMKGRLLEVTDETESGEIFSRETTTWADPPRALNTGTNGLTIRFAHPVLRTEEILERGAGTPRRLESEFEFDSFGNRTRQSEYGIVENGDRSAHDDERVSITEYAVNMDSWIVRLPMRQQVQDENGAVISRSETYYDDETFSATNLGVATVGNVTLQRSWIDPANPSAFVATSRSRYDIFGNPIAAFDPVWDSAAGEGGHFRELEYDAAFHAFPVRETIHVGNGSAPLIFNAAYDEGLGAMLSSTDFNTNSTAYTHDAFGRLTAVVRPDDSPDLPTIEYDYALAVPVPAEPGLIENPTGIINYVESRQLDCEPQPGSSKRDLYFISRAFTDGLGRALMTRAEAEPAANSTGVRVVVNGAVLFNARRETTAALSPFFTTQAGSLDDLLAFESVEAPGWRGQFHENGALVSLDLTSAHQSRFSYDATLRQVSVVNPDGTIARAEFEPLVTRQFDENDSDPVSPHFSTPRVQFTDGLGRLVRVDEVVRLNDDGTPSASPRTWTTRYGYNLNDRLTRITDSQGNIKELRYDGLLRRIWMNDPDGGITTNVYDHASNLIETTDAKGQRISYTYDGANRITTEDYHDGASPEFTYGRTPDVRYRYDVPAGEVDQGNGTSAAAQNTRGMLSAVEDSSGEEHTSYDARGRVQWAVKRVPDPLLSPSLSPAGSVLVSYKTEFEYDSMDRVHRTIYPDNDAVTYSFNARTLLAGIAGASIGSLLSNVVYAPSGQTERMSCGNGISSAREYDSRSRLARLVAQPASATSPVIDFTYTFDNASNLRAIEDRRSPSSIPAEDRRRNSQSFEYDDLYRLSSARFNAPSPASLNGGQLSRRYDRIGNLLSQSSDIEHLDQQGISVTDLGNVTYGGSAGASGRIGRSPGDPPGPHALTSITHSNPTNGVRSYEYDANGNIRALDGLRCTWDFRDRLVAVENDTVRADYRYDYAGSRVAKKILWKKGAPGPSTAQSSTTATIYVGPHFEVRDHGAPVKYVFSGNTRIATITGSLTTRPRIQRLRLVTGWNLVSIAVTVTNTSAQLASAAIESVYQWSPVDGRYAPLSAGQLLAAGSVLWIKARTNLVMSLVGPYAEPTPREVPAGASYVTATGLEASLLPFSPASSVSYYDATERRWRWWFPSALAPASDLPAALAPGEAVFLQSDDPVVLAPPDPPLRVRYFHQDHIGSSSVITDAAGALVEEVAFYPFGTPRHRHRPRGMDEPYLFAQKERDRESGLHYFEARFLSGLSRFISVDAASANPDSLSDDSFAALLANPQKMNLYAYCLNRPTTLVDPTGHWELDYGGEGAPDQATIVKTFSHPEVARLGLAYKAAGTMVLRIPVDIVNTIFGATPANAPDRGQKTLPRVSEWEHTKNVVITFGGGKILTWAGGKIFRGGGALEGGAAPTATRSSIDPYAKTGVDPLAKTGVNPAGKTMPGAPPPAPVVSKGAQTYNSASGDVARAASAASAAQSAQLSAYYNILRPIQDALRPMVKAGAHPSEVTNLALTQADMIWRARYGTTPPGSL